MDEELYFVAYLYAPADDTGDGSDNDWVYG